MCIASCICLPVHSKLFALQFVEMNLKTDKHPKIESVTPDQLMLTRYQQINIEVKFGHMVWFSSAAFSWSLVADNSDVGGSKGSFL